MGGTAEQAPNNLPAPRLFVGRAREIAAIEEALRRDNQTTIGQASVFGLGGVGKTALALEVAHRALKEGGYPGGIWWGHAEGKPIDALVKLGAILREDGPALVRAALASAGTEAAEIAKAVQRTLRKHGEPTLLVLDNVSEGGWKKYLPGGEVRVLMTTRDQRLGLGEVIGLAVLSGKEARDLAVKIAGKPRGRTEAKALERVVEKELGGLAVAVDVAARAVKRLRMAWGEYARHLGDAQARRRLLEQPDPSSDNSEGAAAAIDYSIGLCEQGSPAWPFFETASNQERT